MIKCPQCKSGWEVLNGENFCGWCGVAVYAIDCRLKNGDQIIYSDLMEDECELMIEILNTGIKNVEIDEVSIIIKQDQ